VKRKVFFLPVAFPASEERCFFFSLRFPLEKKIIFSSRCCSLRIISSSRYRGAPFSGSCRRWSWAAIPRTRWHADTCMVPSLS